LNLIYIEITISLEDIQYEYHLKIISYKIESPYIPKEIKKPSSQKTVNKSNLTDNSFVNKNVSDPPPKKNYIKLILTLQPNTIENTKLLTLSIIDYSEILNENILKDIIQYLFDNLKNVLLETIPITKNCESIIVNANINLVYNFWANWRTHMCGEDIVKNIKFNGDPKVVGNTLEFTYLNKYNLVASVEEANSFIQNGNEDDNHEWNYKYKLIQEGQSEYLNCVFVSCENGTKTWVSVENDINEKIGIEGLQELSKRKLKILNSMKDFIEKNIEYLKTLSNDEY